MLYRHRHSVFGTSVEAADEEASRGGGRDESEETKTQRNVADVEADEDLEAILYSNRSGCYYEMGNYGK